MNKKMSGILLAGGESSRMGEDKAFMIYGGKELYRYPLEILEYFCDEIIISSDNKTFNNTAYKKYPDKKPGLGPLGGLFTCLNKIQNNYAIVLSCDTPGIDIECINELVQLTDKQSIIVGFNADEKPEALVGIYNKNCILSIGSLINSGNYRMSELLKIEDTYYHKFSYPETKLRRIFFNINTKEDYKKLMQNGI